ncbi:N-terminal acetyltransferase A complex catalytic subunit ard1 [Saitozyma podzolica]|uniref:N-terminal acetyltransferase A complex catalytic subunit ard1 n=1 Tax=Saitozyma podzolica TaxID=1890683 RepID=A0A427Y7G6_9TREE|nr:N-terminal acetyltransferase A complex catalytic subunit ard1 [Saitozyma podzolica]
MAVATEMDAVFYSKVREFEIKKVPVPSIGPDEVLIKVSICGLCGTDAHIHEGEFISKFPLVPGHEVIGTIVDAGENVDGFRKGDRVAADNTVVCGWCHYCRRGEPLYCENFSSAGVTCDGGFAEYFKCPFSKCFKINNLTDEEATLIEPASCAVHGMDRLRMPFGAKVLLIGAGPTGLILAQLMKMDIARRINAADAYIDLDRANADDQWESIKADNPYGFDVVAECTGVEKIVNNAIDYVSRGGTLLVYGVYADAARVAWSPTKIFVNEINCFPRAVQLLDSKKIKTEGIVTDVFRIADYQKALDKMNSP